MKLYENMFARVLKECMTPKKEPGKETVRPGLEKPRWKANKTGKKGRTIREAADALPPVITPETQPPSDEDVWKSKLSKPEMASKFDTEGIPPEVASQYSDKIGAWKNEVAEVSKKFEEIYDFAVENAERTGADKIFSEIGQLVEDSLTTLGTLEGKLKFLDKKIDLVVRKENTKNREKMSR